jgi:hypothetical protein
MDQFTHEELQEVIKRYASQTTKLKERFQETSQNYQ